MLFSKNVEMKGFRPKGDSCVYLPSSRVLANSDQEIDRLRKK